MTKLKEAATKPTVRITDWVNFYSFDVMGDIGFSRSFGMVEKGEEADVIKLLHASMSPLSVFGHINWGLNLATRTSAGAKALLDHIDWTSNVLNERQKVSKPDSGLKTQELTSIGCTERERHLLVAIGSKG